MESERSISIAKEKLGARARARTMKLSVRFQHQPSQEGMMDSQVILIVFLLRICFENILIN